MSLIRDKCVILFSEPTSAHPHLTPSSSFLFPSHPIVSLIRIITWGLRADAQNRGTSHFSGGDDDGNVGGLYPCFAVAGCRKRYGSMQGLRYHFEKVCFGFRFGLCFFIAPFPRGLFSFSLFYYINPIAVELGKKNKINYRNAIRNMGLS